MLTSEQEFEKIAALAYIETDTSNTQQLANDLGSIMAFVEQLRNVNTSMVAPLLHPLNLTQSLRIDHVTEVNHVSDLEKIAPLFSDGLYLVPKVIDSGK